MQEGIIFNIQRFSVNDGPGIRTTVFYKGCPLNCLWCHNPESKSKKKELLFDEKKCVLCGACAVVCPNDCHSFDAGEHFLDRTKCVACGACAEACAPEALELVGNTKTVEQVVEEVLKDQAFYETSGGGMTLTGGEPMAQFDFTMELLRLGKEAGLHICMETCGFSSAEKYALCAEYVDLFLWDWKLTDRELHKMYTGVYNDTIIDNLRLLDSMGAKFVLRCPIIPGINDNDGHFRGIAHVANSHSGVTAVEVEPYHPLGKAKSERLGREYSIGDIEFPDNARAEEWIARIASFTDKPVRRG